MLFVSADGARPTLWRYFENQDAAERWARLLHEKDLGPVTVDGRRISGDHDPRAGGPDRAAGFHAHLSDVAPFRLRFSSIISLRSLHLCLGRDLPCHLWLQTVDVTLGAFRNWRADSLDTTR